MRFLRHPSPFQLRLGYLRVIAALAHELRKEDEQQLRIPEPLRTEGGGSDIMEARRRLRLALAEHLDRVPNWLEDAGFRELPQGNITPTNLDRLDGMGLGYGIQDATTFLLTDLGHVLRAIAPWQPDANNNPLRWEGPARWIGLWLLVQAAGDVILPLLRNFSPEELTTREVGERLANQFREMARTADPEDRQLLLHQAAGAVAEQTARLDARQVIYPYVEPLRDLGYLVRGSIPGGRGSGYRLTEHGARLRASLETEASDVSRLLRTGLSRLYLRAEGVQSLRAAPAPSMLPVLIGMPDELTVLHREEVPLEAAVLLTQARLCTEDPGAWIDIEHAQALLRDASERSGGKIYLKRGDSTRELNVAWQGQEVLTETLASAEQSVPLPPDGPSSSSAAEGDAERHGRDQADALQEGTEPTSVQTTSPPPEPDGAPITNPSPSGTGQPNSLLDEGISPRLRLWLQALEALLAPPVLGAHDVAAWGGLSVGLSRLYALAIGLPQHRLREKREWLADPILQPRQQKASTTLVTCTLRRLQDVLDLAGEGWRVRRALLVWEAIKANNTNNIEREPTPLLERALRIVDDVTPKLRDRIEAFLDEAGPAPMLREWRPIWTATRALIHDALALGIWSAVELRARFHECIRRHPPREAAGHVLDMVTSKPRPYVYMQRRAAPVLLDDVLANPDSVSNQLTGITVRRSPKVGDNGEPRLEISVEVTARSPYEARVLGRARSHEELLALCEQRMEEGRTERLEIADVPDSEEIVDEEDAPADLPPAPAGLAFGALEPAHRKRSTPLTSPGSGRTPPTASHRLTRARRGISLARRPDRREQERLPDAWAAVEQLVTAGGESKAVSVSALAAAASVLHIRHELARLYREARASLWATALLDPIASVDELVAVWLADIADELRRARGALEESRRRHAIRGPHSTSPTNEQAIDTLWNNRAQVATLRDAVAVWSPLVANELQRFLDVTSDGKGDFSTPGNGERIATYFQAVYEEYASFFAFVYELRNRFVHAGEAFDASRAQDSAAVLERFLALIEPVLDSVEAHVNGGADLPSIWGHWLDVAHELASLPDDKATTPLSLERLKSILLA